MCGTATILKIPAGMALAVGLLVLAGCHRDSGPEVLARIGTTEIRADQFAQKVRAQQALSPVPVNQRALLQDLVDREVMLQAARKAGLADDPGVVEAVNSVLISTLKERQLNPLLEAVSVPEEEVRAAYEREHEQWVTPESARLAVLFVEKGNGSAAAQARTRIDTALSLVTRSADGAETPVAGPGFGALAVNYSEDQETRYQGGDLGWVERDRYPRRIEPAVIEAGFALTRPGQVSDVIAGTRGWYVVKLIEKQAAVVKPFNQVASTIRQRLLRSRRTQAETDFAQHLRQGLPVEMHVERLQDTPAAEPPPPPAHAF